MSHEFVWLIWIEPIALLRSKIPPIVLPRFPRILLLSTKNPNLGTKKAMIEFHRKAKMFYFFPSDYSLCHKIVSVSNFNLWKGHECDYSKDIETREIELWQEEWGLKWCSKFMRFCIIISVLSKIITLMNLPETEF